MKITIIGAGPGGYEAAIYAAKQGAQVTLVEAKQVGGTCLNRGCIPTKALLASAEVLHTAQKAKDYGVVAENVTARQAELVARKNKVVSGLVKGVEHTLAANRVTLVKGHGHLVGGMRIEVELCDGGTEVLEPDAILLATGSVASVPGFIQPNGETIITSDELLNSEELPQSIIILGGGVIGCEFGQYLARMGCAVTIVEKLPHLLPMEDKDVAEALQRQFRREKIKCICGTGLAQVQTTAKGVSATLENGTELQAEKLLVAVGRSPFTLGLCPEAVGITVTKRGHIVVDEQMRTNVGNIYAIGDLVPTAQLAHVASKEGFVAIDNMLGKPAVMRYHAVPRCIYTYPEVACVGATQEELDRQGQNYHMGRFDFMANGKAKAAGKPEGFVKVLTNEQDVLIGAAIVGAHATEMLQVLTLAVEAGLTAKQVGAAIYPHPTMSEAIMEALHDLHGMSIHRV